MIIYEVASLTEFEQITKGFIDKLWFRGQPCASYNLLPSLYRFSIFLLNTYGGYDQHFRNEKIAILKMQKYFNEKNRTNLGFLQTMYKAQHHGLPTRLLDFSSERFVALYFAVESAKLNQILDLGDPTDESEYSKKYSSVYCINPLIINKLSIDREEIVGNNVENEIDINLMTYPIAINPPVIDKRIRAQKSKFLLYGSLSVSFDDILEYNKELVKILIHKKACLKLYEELKTIGYSHSSIFPDIEGIVKETIYEMEKYYIKNN